MFGGARQRQRAELIYAALHRRDALHSHQAVDRMDGEAALEQVLAGRNAVLRLAKVPDDTFRFHAVSSCAQYGVWNGAVP